MRQLQFLHGAALLNTDLLYKLDIWIRFGLGYYELYRTHLLLLHEALDIVLALLTQPTILLVLGLQGLVVLHLLGGVRRHLCLLGI